MQDILNYCEADYDSLVDRAEAVCVQRTKLQHKASTDQLQKLTELNSELQAALQTLTSLQSSGMLSATAYNTAAEEITDRIDTNQQQADTLRQMLASLQDPAVLEKQTDRLIFDSLSEGCSNSRERRRVNSSPKRQ